MAARTDLGKARELISNYIKAQELQPGDCVPSERTLSETLGLSRRAVANAVNEMVREGSLYRKPRSGTYVAYPDAGRSGLDALTIAVVMPWLAGRTLGYEITPNPQTPLFRVPFGSESMTLQIMHGIVAAANEHSARIVTYANNSPEEEEQIFQRLAREDVSGVIVMPRRELTGAFNKTMASGKPLVFMDHYFAGIEADHVVTDNKTAAREAVGKLVAQGHRRIALFTSFSDMTSIVHREAGYREALEEGGIAYDEDIVRGYEAMRNHEWGYDLALEHCTRLGEPVTAVFCVDDFAVEKTLAAAGRLGLSVPGDIEISGFFEYQIPESLTVPFDRVVQDKFTIGQTACRLVIDRVLGNLAGPARHIEVPASLVLRQ